MADEVFKSRPRKATGPDRPRYLDHGDVDRVLAVLLALASEVAALRERLDTHERLAASGVLANPDAVERYLADDSVEAAREAWRDTYIKRIFRVITEDIDSLQACSEGNGPDEG